MQNENSYKAYLRQNGEGKAFFTDFRHPIVLDTSGKQGKKIKKGLGMERSYAEKVVEEINWLLSNYQIATKELAKSKGFEEKSIECFFGPISKKQRKTKEDLLKGKITRPTRSDGYVTVAAIGATGSGKTSVIRNIIGTNPNNISFPAVSSNRTTTATTEYIFSDNPLAQAAILFMSEVQAEQYVRENIIAAIREQIINDADNDDIADALLTHSDLRFKLGYILGHYKQPTEDTETEQNDYALLHNLVEKAQRLKIEAEEYFRKEQIDFNSDDERTEFYIDYYFEDESSGIEDLVDDVILQIKNKISAFSYGVFEKLNGWPEIWFAQGDKDDILKHMEFFAGNDGRKFGQLFAPIVTDIRIKANFTPYRIFEDREISNLTLIDTVGIGHSTKAIDSLDTEIVDIASKSDLILFVDNGSNPVNQNTNVAVRDLLTRGLGSKMLMLYTHMDMIEDLSAVGPEDQQRNIYKVLQGAMKGFIDLGVSRSTIDNATKRFKEYRFFLPRTNNLKTVKDNHKLLQEIERFIDIVNQKSNEIVEEIDITPVYEYGGLYPVVSESIKIFNDRFRNKLKTNHWTRVKAMTHRISQLKSDGYDDLKPLSHIMSHFSIRLDNFLKSPTMWLDQQEHSCSPPESKQATILDQLVTSITSGLQLRLSDIMIEQYLDQWEVAYRRRGTGSASVRMKDVEFILDSSLTIPKHSNKRDETYLVKQIEDIVRNVLLKNE